MSERPRRPEHDVPAEEARPAVREGREEKERDHRFAADEEAADGAAGAEEARTPGMGS
jgi:hypothetical protein